MFNNYDRPVIGTLNEMDMVIRRKYTMYISSKRERSSTVQPQNYNQSPAINK